MAAATSAVGTCRKGHTFTTTAKVAYDNGRQVRCPGTAATDCGCWTVLALVYGKLGKRECGEWCTDGVGKSCTCTCGGQNHGRAWRIK